MKTSTEIFKFTIPLSYKIAVFGLLTLAAFIWPKSTNAQDYVDTTTIDSFFQANPDHINDFAGRSQRPVSYLYVFWDDVMTKAQLYQNSRSTSYVLLGISNFKYGATLFGGGVPQKAAAIAYARTIGANLVLYGTKLNTDGSPEHLIVFLGSR